MPQRISIHCVRSGFASRNVSSCKNDDFHFSGYACLSWRNILSEVILFCGGIHLKVVVFRSPKILKGILKLIFKIDEKES